jgi:hypothetical protein
MNDIIQLFLLASVEDEYHTFLTGSFQLNDATCSKIEKQLNSTLPETIINTRLTNPDKGKHQNQIVELWAVKISKNTGGDRPGRQFMLAISHDERIESEELNFAVNSLGGILGLCKDFYETTTNSSSVLSWLGQLPGHLYFALWQKERELRFLSTRKDSDQSLTGRKERDAELDESTEPTNLRARTTKSARGFPLFNWINPRSSPIPGKREYDLDSSAIEADSNPSRAEQNRKLRKLDGSLESLDLQVHSHEDKILLGESEKRIKTSNSSLRKSSANFFKLNIIIVLQIFTVLLLVYRR